MTIGELRKLTVTQMDRWFSGVGPTDTEHHQIEESIMIEVWKGELTEGPKGTHRLVFEVRPAQHEKVRYGTTSELLEIIKKTLRFKERELGTRAVFDMIGDHIDFYRYTELNI